VRGGARRASVTANYFLAPFFAAAFFAGAFLAAALGAAFFGGACLATDFFAGAFFTAAFVLTALFFFVATIKDSPFFQCSVLGCRYLLAFESFSNHAAGCGRTRNL